MQSSKVINFKKVLILLLVEYPFGPDFLKNVESIEKCLNPSFSGISFRTPCTNCNSTIKMKVLILLLVEYPFGQHPIQ